MSQTLLHLFSAHTSLASASIRFLAAFSAGVSTRFAGFAVFVRLDGTSDRSSNVVDRTVDVDFIDIASFSDLASMLGRYVLVIIDVVM